MLKPHYMIVNIRQMLLPILADVIAIFMTDVNVMV